MLPETDNTITVAALSVAIKRHLEGNFASVKVRGEISGFKRSGGHCYLTLKDAGGCIDGVIWQSVVPRLAIMPADGIEVIASARVTTYADRSKYQLVITQLQLAGIGSIMQQLEERKQKLIAEGLFAPEHKKALPRFPRTIAVMTSPTGAVIRDILHRIAERYPVHVLVVPVVVQGSTAAANMVQSLAALQTAVEQQQIAAPDVLIIARGGGSFEDLLPFYDEQLLRAVFACPYPVISAVGHETDTTFIDYVSDLRAPTPTAAAEHAVPHRRELMTQLQQIKAHLQQTILRTLSQQRNALLAQRLPATVYDVLSVPQQRLDTLSQRLPYLIRQVIANAQHQQQRLAGVLQPTLLQRHLQRATEQLAHVSQRLQQAQRVLLQQHQHRLHSAAQLLETLSYKAILKRGYALVSTANGQPIALAQQIAPQQELCIQLCDGSVNVISK